MSFPPWYKTEEAQNCRLVGTSVRNPNATSCSLTFLVSWFCLRFKGGWWETLMSLSQVCLFQALVKGNTSGSQSLHFS